MASVLEVLYVYDTFCLESKQLYFALLKITQQLDLELAKIDRNKDNNYKSCNSLKSIGVYLIHRDSCTRYDFDVNELSLRYFIS